MKSKLQGIVPPVITPLTVTQQVDVSGLERLIAHIAGGMVHGLFILGTTGEGPSLSVPTQLEMIRESCRIVKGTLPLLVGISGTSFAETLSIAHAAREAGADALVAAPPCYFPLNDNELLEYFGALTREIALPLFLYNMPAMTKTSLNIETVKRIGALPGVAGYKDSSGNMVALHEVLRAFRGREDFSIFVGPEELLGEAVLFGADGGVCGGANLDPGLFVAMYQAARNRDIELVNTLQDAIYHQREIYFLEPSSSSIIKGLKSALSELGICQPFMAFPFAGQNAETHARVQSFLKAQTPAC